MKHKFTLLQRLLEEDQLLNKSYQNIKDTTDLLNMPRETAVALFRLEIGHDCLTKLLHRIGCLPTSKHPLCKQDTIKNKSHLSEFKTLSGDNLTALYWKLDGALIFWHRIL